MKIIKNKRILWITIFAITMGIFEAAIVIYLRALYYPTGFDFPLIPIDNTIAITEIIREFASLIMLLSVAILTGKNLSQRFAMFIYSFAIWDIVYYIFLKLILNWPESFFSWDILFLLPVTWTGPVISPIVISLIMILLALVINKFNKKKHFSLIINKYECLLLIGGAFVVFLSFIWDYSKYLISNFNEIKSVSFTDKLFNLSVKYIPQKFNWILFFVGVAILLF
ncbi:MAG: hypothetical protein U9R54_01935, partial [Bacteroidota bacterium]|nr:hypothetical protein [Bacteroidota bacterium]